MILLPDRVTIVNIIEKDIFMSEVKCQWCRKLYQPDRATQRFCSKQCSDRWWAAERRRGIEALRNTYHGRALLDAVEGEGGRFAAVGPENFGAPLPIANWSRDPCGPEPPIEGNGLTVGEALGGEGR